MSAATLSAVATTPNHHGPPTETGVGPNRFFVNTEDIRDRLFALVSSVGAASPTTATPAWVLGVGAVPAMLSTPGHAILRDLGRTVYVAGPLREVQVVTEGAESGPCADNNFLRAYLRMPASVVRLG